MELDALETYCLACHPDTPSSAIREILVEVSTPKLHQLRLWFVISGDIERMSLPAHSLAERRDGLWQTTCCEAFLQPSSSPDYIEFNFSPSTRWAAYSFDSYRAGSRDAALVAPTISTASVADRFALGADLAVPDGFRAHPLRLGLSAVIEETDGTKSYWALAHPPGKPDFHHPTCFAATLPPPEAP